MKILKRLTHAVSYRRKQPTRSAGWLVATLAAAVFVGACGQKGPLVLPDQPAKTASPANISTH